MQLNCLDRLFRIPRINRKIPMLSHNFYHAEGFLYHFESLFAGTWILNFLPRFTSAYGFSKFSFHLPFLSQGVFSKVRHADFSTEFIGPIIMQTCKASLGLASLYCSFCVISFTIVKAFHPYFPTEDISNIGVLFQRYFPFLTHCNLLVIL